MVHREVHESEHRDEDQSLGHKLVCAQQNSEQSKQALAGEMHGIEHDRSAIHAEHMHRVHAYGCCQTFAMRSAQFDMLFGIQLEHCAFHEIEFLEGFGVGLAVIESNLLLVREVRQKSRTLAVEFHDVA